MLHSPRLRPLRRSFARALALGAVVASLAGALPATTSGAAPIDDLRAQARDLEGKINTVQSELAALYEQIKATQYRIDEAKATIADAEARIAAAQAEVERIKVLVSERAAAVYRRAGRTGITQFDTDIRQQASRRKYADATNQHDDLLLRQLAGAKEELAGRRAAAEEIRAEVQHEQDGLKAREAEFESQKAELKKLESGVKGEIARLVAEEQARRAREEALARARLRAAAANNTTAGGAAAFDTSQLPKVSGAAGVAVAFATGQLGVPYCYAGIGPGCYDCSGLTQQAWALAGVSMPHNSEAQYARFPRIPLSQVQPGDLTWFPGHIGIYVGNGLVVNATHTGDVVRYHHISLYQGAVRPG